MKQQIIIIGGGTSFENYQDYISFLKNHEINFDKLKSGKGWKDSLEEDLGENFEVLLPRMPNPTNAVYEEWKIWLERIIKLCGDDLIFIGHSLGGIFLAKYFSENIISKKIKAVFLVAAPFDDANSEESLIPFKLPDSLAKFEEQCKNIYLLQSRDDVLVLFEEMEKYQKSLPSAKPYIFDGRGHFNLDTFPEIVKLIKEIK